MNKLLICLLFLVSCQESSKPIVLPLNTVYTNKFYTSTIYKFNYKEHSYIEFQSGTSTWGVHDPDCKCKK